MNVPFPPLRSSGSALPVAVVIVLAAVAGFGGRLFGQAEAKIDFARDVQPLLKERCIGCHGPSQTSRSIDVPSWPDICDNCWIRCSATG